MNSIPIATCVGLIPMDIDSLLQGKATAGLAMKLGVTVGDIELFIKGSASYGITKRLGLASADAATDLAQAVGTQGAIGIVVGLLFTGGR
jgi:hypothetical protein